MKLNEINQTRTMVRKNGFDLILVLRPTCVDQNQRGLWEQECLRHTCTQPQSIPDFSARFGRLVDRALVKRALEAR